MVPYTVASPSPVPRSPLVVKNGSSLLRESGSQYERAAVGHVIDGVEDQVGGRFPNFIVSAHDRRQVRGQLSPHLDGNTTLLCHIAPARARQVHDLLHDGVHVHWKQRHLRFTLAIELAHACDGLRYIINGTLDGFELAAGAWTQAGLLLQERFGVKRHRRNCIVDIVRDTARHLAEGQQTLLLHHRLLRLTQVFVRLLQSAVELRLMGCQGDVLARLPQKLAFATAEAVRLLAGSDEDAEHLALDQQGSCDHRAQSPSRQALGKRERDLSDIRLVNEPALDALRQSVLIDLDASLRAHRKLHRECFAVQADARDDHAILGRVVQADAAEIHRQLLFERADDDLKDALDVLPLADRSGDLLEQAEARELGLHLDLRELAVGDVPSNVGCADDAALAVPDGGDGDGYIDSPSILSNA